MAYEIFSFKTDEFEIEACDLEELKKIRIGHDNQEKMDAWFLDNVTIWEADNQSKRWQFPCGRWFAVDQVNKILFHQSFF